MTKTIGKVKLKTGEEMVVKRVEPPAEEYVERLSHFLEHKQLSCLRDIKQRLEGYYIESCIDKYFIGEIDGVIAAQLWYGLPRNGTGIGNFGHVYTEPSHRKKGLVNKLMEFFIDDFNESDGLAIFCGTGSPWVAGIYIKYGFRLIEMGKDCGHMVLIKEGYAKNFEELEEKYFEKGLKTKVEEGGIGDRHDCDEILVYSKGVENLGWHRTFINHYIPTYRDVFFCKEDDKGKVFVLKTVKGSVVGYAFIVSAGSAWEKRSRVMDFVIHPYYLEEARFLLEESIKIACEPCVYAFIPSCDRKKLEVMQSAGFRKEYAFADYVFVDNKCYDMWVLKKGVI